LLTTQKRAVSRALLRCLAHTEAIAAVAFAQKRAAKSYSAAKLTGALSVGLMRRCAVF
jgi:hypothetical protein